MKKLITILAIMIVLVGAAFATTGDTSNGTAVIDITATIAAKYPTFRLGVGTVSSGSASTDYSNVASSNVAHGSVSLTTDLTATAATIQFKIYQISTTRGASNYRLMLKGTDLENTAYATSGATDGVDANEKFTYSAGTFNVNAPAAASKVTVTAKSSSDTGFTNQDGGYTVVNAADSYLLAGTGSPAAVELGNVTYTWSANPAAITGTYTATVTLTVEAY